MWTTIYVATDKKQAESIENSLKAEGFLVKVKSVYDSESGSLFEILVLKYEAEDAQDALMEKGII
ncbi:hypothetical protein [Tissierella sp. Yu-01]|uniref:hypothetical protein n=1 Tax=Tissierella sp. Yu-01 TaxID=3035694 RepID=UPI00240DFCD5|nr:hypothetical protein [Tissierella sp. Yu-01]WFA09172.1 hypothetical protein P3962_00965 [Tissierella sp. Yu-01]